MELSVGIFDALSEDATFVRGRGSDQRGLARDYAAYLSTGGAAAHILTSVNGRPALASRRATGTGVS
jgi:hypothetical protein